MKFDFKSILKSRLFMYGFMIFGGYVFTAAGGWDFYAILKFIAIFVVYEVWIQVLLPMWEESEIYDK